MTEEDYKQKSFKELCSDVESKTIGLVRVVGDCNISGVLKGIVRGNFQPPETSFYFYLEGKVDGGETRLIPAYFHPVDPLEAESALRAAELSRLRIKALLASFPKKRLRVDELVLLDEVGAPRHWSKYYRQ